MNWLKALWKWIWDVPLPPPSGHVPPRPLPQPRPEIKLIEFTDAYCKAQDALVLADIVEDWTIVDNAIKEFTRATGVKVDGWDVYDIDVTTLMDVDQRTIRTASLTYDITSLPSNFR